MRAIRFRAWDTWGKSMYYPLMLPNPLENNGREYMQFTGLLDRQGKEIYEGDIVKDNHPFVPTKKIQYVEWLDEGACFIFRDKSGDDWWCPNCDYVGARMAVIGNIYETPVLLNSQAAHASNGEKAND